MCPKSPSFLITVSFSKMGLRIQGKHLSCWIYLIRYENAVLNTHMAQVKSFLVNKKNTRILHGSTSYYAELRKYILKVYSNFASYLGICSREEDQIHNVATLDGAYPILTIPCPMLLRRLKGQGRQQVWYWPPKPEYAVSSINRVSAMVSDVLPKQGTGASAAM